MANSILQNAIHVGVPLYNGGDVGKCSEIYTQAAYQVLTDVNLAQQLDFSTRQLLESALRSPAADASAQAWQLRHAFDAQLTSKSMLGSAARKPVKLATVPSVVKQDSAHRGQRHRVRGTPLHPPFPNGFQECTFGAGCFWGTEKGFWRLPGVYTTAVGYCGGHEGGAEPSYEDVCSGSTGHNEVTRVVWDPSVISFADILRQFWRCHDPSQGNRQGNDTGTQYRSGIYCSDEIQAAAARASLMAFEPALRQRGFPAITTEICVATPFHYAEEYHQQYLARSGARQYCSAEPTGVALPAFGTWPLECAVGAQVRASFGPKLPEAFWSTYDSSVSAPNEPVELSVEALSAAVAEAEVAERTHVALLASAERDHIVVVSYCGGCGFKKRADEFAEEFQRVVGLGVGLVKDIGITGNFDVKIRQRDGTFELVHSKKAGDGFVDSHEKLQRIVSAAQKAPHVPITE